MPISTYVDESTEMVVCYGRMIRKLLLLLSLCGLLAGASSAEVQLLAVRTLPVNGKLGRTGDAQPLPMVQIGGKSMRLAPGGVIFDQHNRTVVHGSLPTHANILYTADANGSIQRIYVLTDEERARVEQAQRK